MSITPLSSKKDLNQHDLLLSKVVTKHEESPLSSPTTNTIHQKEQEEEQSNTTEFVLDCSFAGYLKKEKTLPPAISFTTCVDKIFKGTSIIQQIITIQC